MATPGKFVAAAVSATSEITAALATINFDFSLIKVEAPREFAVIGKSLTKRRKAEAEDGLSHTVARKLAALFYGELPDTPALLAAYGERASEIISSPKANPKGSAADGPFAAHVGAEATTLWAAATSGKEAIAVHLLACLLARIWPAAEAISIWMDLVEQRKRRIEKEIEAGSSMHAGSTFAARVELTRAHLTDLDAGTRSWLRTADRIKEVQQTQLRLIIDNISIPVSRHDSTYETVMEAWRVSMTLTEDLILGKPQRVQSGALLLGLSAWHLYPDMSVPGSCNSYVKQGDSLVAPGGIATVGLQDRPNAPGRGVHWSMMLNHLKYYGKAEVTTRYSGAAEHRVSFEEYMYVAIGSIFSTWGSPSISTDVKISVLSTVTTYFQHLIPWMNPIKAAADRYQRLKDVEKNRAERLISLGMRHSPAMLGPPKEHPKPVFGLTDLALLLYLCKDAQSRIELLRTWAEPQKDRLLNAVIRYFEPGSDTEHFVFLCPRSDKERTTSAAEADHWIREKSSNSRSDKLEVSHIEREEVLSGTQTMDNSIHNEPSHFEPYQPQPNTLQNRSRVSNDHEAIQFDVDAIYFVTVADKLCQYRFLAGDPHQASILVPLRTSRSYKYRNMLSIDQLQSIFLNRRLLTTDESTLEAFWLLGLHGKGRALSLTYKASLQTLSMVSECYANLPGAQIALQARKWPLYMCPFVVNGMREPITPESIFSCIAYFETGYAQLPLAYLRQTMAICYQDSMYVSESLLCDPFEQPSSRRTMVRRIVGNIGKPGLCILQVPPSPEVREHNPVETWNVVNHPEFDGRYEDNFASTSLHLSFTGSTFSPSWSIQGDGIVKGAIHSNIHYHETVISAYDSDGWIADLDILGAIEKFKFGWDPVVYNEERNTIERRLVTADCWNEILDEPDADCIVQAADNWVARLTAATVLTQLGRNVRVISPSSRPKYDPIKVGWNKETEKLISSQLSHCQHKQETPKFIWSHSTSLDDYDFSSDSEDTGSYRTANEVADDECDSPSVDGMDENYIDLLSYRSCSPSKPHTGWTVYVC